MTVVVGVDGAGRTRRLDEIAATAAGAALRVIPPVGTLDEVAAQLATAAADGRLVLVDDAHRLGADELRLLAATARRGVAMVVARRPTIDSAELADLDEAVGARGAVEQLEPLGVEEVTALIAAVTGRPAGVDASAAVHAASAGLPAVAVAVALAPRGVPSPALVARVQRRMALLDPAVAGLARVLALRLDLADDVLAAASELDGPSGGQIGTGGSGQRVSLAGAMRALRDEGLLVPGSESMIPAIADALLVELPAAERRRVHEAIARALVGSGSDALAAATQLRAARALIPDAAAVYRAAGDRMRFSDPASAIGWYDDALDSGAAPPTVVAGRAEAAAQLGLPIDLGLSVAPEDADRLVLADGAVHAHQGRADRAAEALAGAAPPGPDLAVPSLLAVGRVDTARAAVASAAVANAAGAVAVRRLAEAALVAAADPAAAVPLFIEAAEGLERTPPAAVLPDTAHALGALMAATAGDVASAEHLLERAIAAGVGGPVFLERHRLLLGWVRLRAGRYDTAVAELGRLAQTQLPGRERFLFAAISAGIARRSGDVARLRDAWAGIEPALARRAVDLFVIEPVEELAVAATRLRRYVRVEPVLAALDDIVEGLGRPAAWAVAVGWIRVQVAIAAEDADAAVVAARRLEAAAAQRLGAVGGAGIGARQRAQCAAAILWARVLDGDVDADAAVAVAEDLAAVELPWEGSRLVGQAAIRISDAAAARRLLERARDLSSAEVTAADGRTETQQGGLSEREVEVARMVLDGGTYREIGARLFISPKTVEHHVARIRTKLGATSRAEFVAALRTVLRGSDQPE